MTMGVPIPVALASALAMMSRAVAALMDFFVMVVSVGWPPGDGG
jgi:hypothetical protein